VISAPSALVFNSFVNTMLWDGGYVVALHHVFIDESGTDAGSPVAAMAGYIFRHDQAKAFSRKWSLSLKKFGLPYAHMKEAIGPSGVYSHLSKAEADASNRALIAQIHAHAVVGFSVVADPMLFEQIVPNPIGGTTIYSFMVGACIRAVNTWAEKRGYNGRLAYFFESGHDSQSEANRFLSAPPANGDGYNFAGHAFMRKADAPPLQAADFLAWHARKYHVDLIQKGKRSYRKDFSALLRQGDFNIVLNENVMNEYRDDMISSRLAVGEFISRRRYLVGLPGYPQPNSQGTWDGWTPTRLVNPPSSPLTVVSRLRPTDA
jgi:Protein of unknown function (DUF3800)